jgi:hypothetical protein
MRRKSVTNYQKPAHKSGGRFGVRANGRRFSFCGDTRSEEQDSGLERKAATIRTHSRKRHLILLKTSRFNLHRLQLLPAPTKFTIRCLSSGNSEVRKEFPNGATTRR